MVMMRLRKVLRELASMTDSRRNVERGAWGASERAASGVFGGDGVCELIWLPWESWASLSVGSGRSGRSVERRIRGHDLTLRRSYLPPAPTLRRSTEPASRATRSLCRTTNRSRPSSLSIGRRCGRSDHGGRRVSLASGNHSAAQNPGEPPFQQPHHRCRLVCLRKQPHSAVSAKPPQYSCKPIAMTCEFGP